MLSTERHAPLGAPSSPFFQVRDTPQSGRAVFANTSIPADTVIWRSPDLTLSVLLREYRREVCAQCFGYDYGRTLEVWDHKVGFAFCGESCQELWKTSQGAVGVEAWHRVEKLVKGRSKEDNEMVDVDLPRPKKEEIEKTWHAVKVQADMIRIVRGAEEPENNVNARVQSCVKIGCSGSNSNEHINSARTNGAQTNGTSIDGDHSRNGEKDSEAIKPTKQHRKALQKALLQRIQPDVMSFCVSGLIWHYNNPSEWDKLLSLAADSTPYPNTEDLVAQTRTYLHLLAILPLPLLPLCTPTVLRTLASRDSHNSFGIRSLEDDGAEFFGYGCWISASFFNHSCGPNIEKKREGRTWEFRLARDVEEGEELCITYLSGEERRLSRGKRQLTLGRNWGFQCACQRCEGV